MNGEPVLRVVCAWCATVEREGDPGAHTSHTICDPCAKKLFSSFLAKEAA